MTSDGEILRSIYQVTKGVLDGEPGLQIPRAEQFLDGFALLRIVAIANTRTERPEDVTSSLHNATEGLLCGLHGARLSCLFVVASNPPDLHVMVGARTNDMGQDTLGAMLQGSFSDVRLVDVGKFDTDAIADLRHALLLTGVPTRKVDTESGHEEDQIETICRGLKGRRWLYVVNAEPVPPIEVAAQANELAARIRDIQATVLSKTGAADHDNRLARRCIELLEAQAKRLETALSQGMWNTTTALFARDALTAGQAKGLLSGAFGGRDSVPQPLRVLTSASRATELTEREQLSGPELATLLRPPREDYPGYELVDFARFGVNVGTDSLSSHRSVHIGTVLDRGAPAGNSIALALNDLARHAFVAGVTGSGKTNTCFSVLAQLWDGGRGIPFLVIEPAKSEYRRLLLSPEFKGMKVFTVGDETVSPIRLNPLAVPTGTLVQSHIDYIKALFGASFVLYPPMPYVLEMSLQDVYVDKGWGLASNQNPRRDQAIDRLYPTLSELATKIGDVVDRLGYDERTTMDVKAGLLARVAMLCRGGGKGLMLDTRRSLPLDTLFNSPCVLELKQLVSDEEKAFVIGLLLILLYEYNEARGASPDGRIKHVTLIEEAHRLLRNASTGPGNDVHANPRGMAIQVFCNILAEIRSFGEGLIIAEQIPTKLAPDVIKNTNLKIMHRIVAEDDRRVVAAAMNMNERQCQRLATLQAGEAVVFSDRLHKPVLVQAPLTTFKSVDSATRTAEIDGTLATFRASNDALLTEFGGCVKCTQDERSVVACRGGPSGRIDHDLQHSGRRLLNALRLNKAVVWDAFVEYNATARRSALAGSRSAYCTFVGLADKDMEDRGRAAGWSHDDVEEASRLACDAVYEIHRAVAGESRKRAEAAAGPSLAAFRNILERLHRIEALPYPGCESCPKPCGFRYDAGRDFTPSILHELKGAFLSTNDDLEGFAQACGTLASRSFSAKDVTSFRCAALCVGVQQFHLLRQSNSIQVTLSRKLAVALERIT